ncbi:hypothetical protein [Vulgatibacter incomptus]|uniref:Uncharacterized protein n=1 Tax=Vulgatibacter incomptus TaxID=1391653 RepID=A0A0K1PE25_9BACT|nr:hypothetical protein [Vulgatibacter incomptus]AKU91676.1 hypothetical protein AKJ08_2063 [Vulgatibacter incomptus]
MPKIGATEWLGSHSPARPTAVLPGVTGPTTLIGRIGVHPPIDGVFPTPPDGSEVYGGLVALDTRTGETRTYTFKDGLPQMDYADVFDDGPVIGTVPFVDLHWLTPDQTFVAACWTHLVVGRAEGDGWAFESATLRAAGAWENASVSAVAYAGGELFVSTDQGVAVVEPSDLKVKRWLELDVSPAWTMDVAASDLDGPVVAVTYARAGTEIADRLAIVRPGAAAAEAIELPPGARPITVAGSAGALWIGLRGMDGRGLVKALVSVDGELRLQDAIGADALEAAGALGGKPFIPNRIAVDEVHARLLVGGAISMTTPGRQGGVLSFPLSMEAGLTNGRPLLDQRWGTTAMLPWQVEILVPDAQGRLWIAGRQLCSETKASVTGLYRVEGVGEDARLVRPLVSGVRSIAVDPVDGNTWLGLRDENPGLACEGLSIQQGVCRLKADGSCEVYAPRVNADSTWLPSDLGVADIAFGEPARRELAFATYRAGTFLRSGDKTVSLMTQLDPGINLRQTSAAWGDGGLWLGSLAEWSDGPDPDIDWDKVNDRSPHGLGYLELDGSGNVTFRRRYSRNQSDSSTIDLPGMPSNAALDVLALPGKRHALVALGVERRQVTYDHYLPDETEKHILGGIAEVTDATVRPIAAPEGVTFRDVVALARGPKDRLYAVDAEAGVFLVDLAAGTSAKVADPVWGPDARATTLAVNADGWMAVGTTGGLFVFDVDGKALEVLGAGSHGRIWSTRFVADRILYVGTDGGLARIALDSSSLPARGPAGSLGHTLWPLDLGCDGARGCACDIDEQCQWGNACTCTVDSCACAPVAACATAPFEAGCACTTDEDCGDRLACLCDGAGCACAAEPSGEECLADCSCDAPGGCPDGWMCQSGIAGRSCVPDEDPRDACLDDCSCEGRDGCPDGWRCQGGFAGQSCVEDEEPQDPCLSDCSCDGPGGCPDGWHCQGGFAGNSCLPN